MRTFINIIAVVLLVVVSQPIWAEQSKRRSKAPSFSAIKTSFTCQGKLLDMQLGDLRRYLDAVRATPNPEENYGLVREMRLILNQRFLPNGWRTSKVVTTPANTSPTPCYNYVKLGERSCVSSHIAEALVLYGLARGWGGLPQDAEEMFRHAVRFDSQVFFRSMAIAEEGEEKLVKVWVEESRQSWGPSSAQKVVFQALTSADVGIDLESLAVVSMKQQSLADNFWTKRASEELQEEIERKLKATPFYRDWKVTVYLPTGQYEVRYGSSDHEKVNLKVASRTRTLCSVTEMRRDHTPFFLCPLDP